MNNRDTILKYLSDLMTESERTEFENSLRTDPQLQEEYKKLKNSLASFAREGEVEVNQVYFNNLIPRIRKKIEEPKRVKLGYLIPVFSMVVVAVLVFLLNIPNSNNFLDADSFFSNSEMNQFISQIDSSQLDKIMQSNFFENYSFYQSGEIAEYVNLYQDESVYYTDDINLVNEYYNISYEINEISEDDLEIIYEELINKKIL